VKEVLLAPDFSVSDLEGVNLDALDKALVELEEMDIDNTPLLDGWIESGVQISMPRRRGQLPSLPSSSRLEDYGLSHTVPGFRHRKLVEVICRDPLSLCSVAIPYVVATLIVVL
jgi:hypothetical protein